MREQMKYITTFLLSLSGILVLCSALVNARDLVNGTVTGQVCWFHLAMVFMATCCIAGVLFQSQALRLLAARYRFSLADGCIILFLVNMILYYNIGINPAPHDLIFWLQLGVLWFMLRVITVSHPEVTDYLFWGIIAIGFVEAIWGMRQLYGWSGSNHNIYKLTGSFYNPGPYSGFLAVVFPLALDKALNLLQFKSDSSNRLRGLLYGFAGCTVFLILTVLPAGMSRTAWLSVLAAAGWIVWIRFDGGSTLKRIWRTHRKKVIAGALISILCIAGLGVGIFLLKKDSANGRLFMWQTTWRAIQEEPVKGSGLGNFAGTYARAQEEYFRSGPASGTEKLVAGTPEYAFNEYLQLWKEEGLTGLILFLLLTGSSFIQAFKNRRTGISGGILALAIFAFASYPFQLPAFKILWIYLLVLANTCQSEHQTSSSLLIAGGKKALLKQGCYFLAVCLLVAGSVGLFYRQKDNYAHFNRWQRLQLLYNNHAGKEALEGYRELYPFLHSSPQFLFEYAQCLNKSSRYTESISVLQRATLLSADPMIYNVMAKNYQALGMYGEAEKCLLKSTYLLPERLYPYYLLTKLYTEPGFYRRDKIEQTARTVLTKEPKVHSRAVQEMREEVKEILKRLTPE